MARVWLIMVLALLAGCAVDGSGGGGPGTVSAHMGGQLVVPFGGSWR